MKTYTDEQIEEIKRAAKLEALNEAADKVREMYDAYQKPTGMFQDSPQAAVYKVMTALIAMRGDK